MSLGTGQPTVALVSTMSGSPWGGSEELWSRAAEALAARGYRVHASVKAWPQRPPRLAELERAGVNVVQRRPATRADRLLARARLRPRDLDGTWLRSTKASLVVISQGSAYEAVPWAKRCRALGIPYVLLAHSASDRTWPDDAAAKQLASAYDGAAAACFVSRATAELVAKQTGASMRNVRIVKNPYGLPYDAPFTWPPDATERYRLAAVGRLELGTKGYDLLLEVLTKPEWRTRPIAVDVYGDGPQRETLRRLITEADLGTMELMGHTTDIAAVWRDHHASVICSRQESMPIVLVEAMLAGRPVIATDVGGIREILKDGETGFLAPSATVAALAEAMERAWQQRHEWAAMGRRAADQVRSFVPRDPVGAFVDMLEEVVAQS